MFAVLTETTTAAIDFRLRLSPWGDLAPDSSTKQSKSSCVTSALNE